ncbi:hypothetical protein MMC29_004191 [Sticta canariensis]|nr:hypothetical protein [Sticta canariensis]
MAEVALAVLPLVISAIEHYKDCFRPLIRYRKFTSELDRFQQRLKIQKAIFRNQCRILLENAVHQDVASQMLEEHSHFLWCDAQTEELLVKQLGSSREACVAVIELIDERLRGIEKESRGFETIIDQEYRTRSIGDKAWRNHAVKKLRFSFSESHLEQSITDLRALNDDFRALAEHENHFSNAQSGATLAKTRSSDMIETYQTIGKASRQVYEALSRACTKHAEHLAHFRIDIEYKSRNELAVSQIKFNMAFTHITFSGNMNSAYPIWFVVDSGLERSLERKFEPTENLGTSTPASLVAAPALPSTSFSIAPVQNSSIRRDLCDYLLRWSCQSTQANPCVGMLESTDCCRYLVYPPAAPVHSRKGQPTSLSQLLSSVSKNGLGLRIPQYEKLRLAKSLAMAVLQYHATPWLKISWRSEDIFFCGSDEDSMPKGKLLLTAPHVNVKVNRPAKQLSQTSTSKSRDFIRNHLLFGLGVLLIEIANSSTIQGLQQPSDLEDGRENQHTEYHVAKRLANSLGREMGASYGKIVQKLLHCDFGCGADLNDPELQTRLHKDVVCELDELERGFRSLQFA